MSSLSRRAAIYARVSSQRQRKQATTQSQVTQLRCRVEQDRHQLLDEHILLDDGYSGSYLDRPALDRLRDLARESTIDLVYIHSPDRLARRYVHQVLLMEKIARWNEHRRRLESERPKWKEWKTVSENLSRFCEYVVAGLPKLSFEEKQKLVRKIIDRIVITAGHVTIKLAIPLSTNLDLTSVGVLDPQNVETIFSIPSRASSDLARLAYETVREMMAAASDEPDARPGMVAVIQTFSSSLKFNPHIHGIVTRGVFLSNGQWHPIPYVDAHKAELVFRHKLLRFLRDRDLISEERIDLLLSWQHSGFSVHNHTTVYPSDTEGLHRLACYLQRAPVNLSRLRYHPESGLLIYEPKAGHDADDSEPIDPLDFIARVLIHIPEPKKHLVHFYGAYANRVRSSTPRCGDSAQKQGEDEPSPPRRALRKRWAELIYKIYEVDPLTCRQCGTQMKIVAFITEPAVSRRILVHRKHKASRQRAPPKPTLNLH